MKNTIGLYGLGVMGASIAKNMMNHGEKVAVYNYTRDLTDQFVQDSPNANAYYDLIDFIDSLERPRKIFLMVTAGPVVDSVIESILPHLEEGDIIMDGGNSYYQDSNRRYTELRQQGIHFISVGVSGGEEGALEGPALMPSGDPKAYEEVAPILEKIAAKVDGLPCCTYLGPEGAGHYVKMIHNGIEYADMQLITEAYQFLREIIGLTVSEISEVFSEWNKTELKSYLIEITADILSKIDDETGKPMVDVILDKAGHKGTGKWTSKEALDLGVPSMILTEAVFARYLSSIKEEREYAARHLPGPKGVSEEIDRSYWVNVVKEALYIGKVCTYAQGFYQYQKASEAYNWSLPLSEIALLFRGGCIIQAEFLNHISDAFQENVDLNNLLLSPFFLEKTNHYQSSLREMVMKGMETGLALPCFSASLTYYDGYRTSSSGANLIQAQRDYFGAHTYERNDKEGTFHTEWKSLAEIVN